MRPDQLQRLHQLEEKLLDVFLVEADPDEWPGKGEKISEMDSQTRGDRYWVKKNAAATGVLSQRVVGMIESLQRTTPADPGGDELRQLDAEISKAEREAERLLKELQTGGKAKREFDKRVHGKP